jgi:hypothetical protein
MDLDFEALQPLTPALRPFARLQVEESAANGSLTAL